MIMLKRRVEFVSATTLLCVLFLACDVRGDACDNKQWDCRFNVSGAAGKIATLFQNPPPNLTALAEQCKTLRDSMSACLGEVRALCPAGTNLNDSMNSMQTAYNGVCGPDVACGFRVSGSSDCSLPQATVSELTSAMTQNPPNVQFVKEKCRHLNATLIPCLAKLAADCSGTPGVNGTITGTRVSLDSLCGRYPICQMEMARCQSSFRSLGAVDEDQRMEQLCRVQKASRDCIHRDMDPECFSVPEIKPVIKTLNTSMWSSACSDEGKQCPQVWRCLNPQSGDISPQCSWLTGRAKCIEDLRDQCPITEEGVTFQQVESLAEEFCQELKKAENLSPNCSTVGLCVRNSELMAKVYGVTKSDSTPNINVGLLLDSKTWCQSLEVAARCYVKSADSCQMDADLLSFMTSQLDRLAAMCSSSYGPAGSTVLVLLMAVLAALSTGSTHHFRLSA